MEDSIAAPFASASLLRSASGASVKVCSSPVCSSLGPSSDPPPPPPPVSLCWPPPEPFAWSSGSSPLLKMMAAPTPITTARTTAMAPMSSPLRRGSGSSGARRPGPAPRGAPPGWASGAAYHASGCGCCGCGGRCGR
jgi:hypothetical protein